MANWQAVYRLSTGELISLGTVIADPLPRGMATVDLGATRPEGRITWNPRSLRFDPSPPIPADVDRVEEYLAALPTNQRKQEVRTELRKLLGPYRWRSFDDPRDLQ